jgi:hypothetical protein
MSHTVKTHELRKLIIKEKRHILVCKGVMAEEIAQLLGFRRGQENNKYTDTCS